MLLKLWGSAFVQCSVVHCFVSFLVLQSSWWGGDSWLLNLFVILVSLRLLKCSVALPHGAMGWSAVCGICGIF